MLRQLSALLVVSCLPWAQAPGTTVKLLGSSSFFGAQTPAPLPETPRDLAPPAQLYANGRPIDTDIGHAAPFLYDWDGDGLIDLLVGQFGEGQLRIYRNVGTQAQPAYDAPEWFEAEGKRVKVPTG